MQNQDLNLLKQILHIFRQNPTVSIVFWVADNWCGGGDLARGFHLTNCSSAFLIKELDNENCLEVAICRIAPLALTGQPLRILHCIHPLALDTS